jgi:hypothetical protein
MPIITAVSSPTTALITSTSDASGNISYVTANTTAMVIDTNQNTTHTGYVSAPNTFGFKNRIINGGMVIDQRDAGANVTIANTSARTYTVDRWSSYATVASKFSVQQNAGSVTPPVGFSNYLGFTSLSAYSVGSGDIFNFNQAIEGFNVADLAWGTANAKTVTLSFQVYSSLTGTFGGYIVNSNNTRCYPFSFTVSNANTWTSISITVAGDTTGTWGTGNGTGIIVGFSLGMGSTYTGTANAWTGSTILAPTGSVSVVGTSGATFYITGVQLEKGNIATPFDWRPYGTELMLCQRYYQTTGVTEFYGQTDYTGNYTCISFPLQVAMRAVPSVPTYLVNVAPNRGSTAWVQNGTANQDSTSTTYASFQVANGSTKTAGIIANVYDSKFSFSAEI